MGSGSISNFLSPLIENAKGSLGLNGWTGFRDAAEANGSLVGNYLLPGSSLLTNSLTSKGSQNQLDSPLGRIANTATGLAGAGVGSGTTGIPSASSVGAGWTNAANGVGNLTGLGNVGTGISDFASGIGDKVSNALGGSTSGGGLTSGDTGFLNSAHTAAGVTPSASSLSAALSTGTGGGGSSYLPLVTAAGGTLNTLNATEQAKKDLLDAQNKSLAALNPYLASGAAANSRLTDLLGTSGNTGASDYGSLNKKYTAEDLQNDPGYLFQLNEGNKALDRQQAAKGSYFSGSALKSAEDYGQGLADTTFKDAYARDLASKQNTYNMYAGQSAAGQSAANSAGTLYDNTGNANANADISSSNSINQLLSSLLSGSGAKRPINIGGQVVYI